MSVDRRARMQLSLASPHRDADCLPNKSINSCMSLLIRISCRWELLQNQHVVIVAKNRASSIRSKTTRDSNGRDLRNITLFRGYENQKIESISTRFSVFLVVSVYCISEERSGREAVPATSLDDPHCITHGFPDSRSWVPNSSCRRSGISNHRSA